MQKITPLWPNNLQLISLSQVYPSENQCRLFFERHSLEDLISIYEKWLRAPNTLLPDAPIVRYNGELDGEYIPDGAPLELLAGERRFRAAIMAGVHKLPMRVVRMSDEEAYDFILAHNNVEGLTTVEIAFRAAELDRLGYTEDEISDRIGASAYRYIAVGQFVDPEKFNDAPKKCDPGITQWYEAARAGIDHFNACFEGWNSGAWDERECARYFRPERATALPLDNNAKGLRLSVSHDGMALNIRGRLDLNLLTGDEIMAIATEFQSAFNTALRQYLREGHFGYRVILNFNPDSLAL